MEQETASLVDDDEEVEVFIQPPNPLRDKVKRLSGGMPDLNSQNAILSELGKEFVARLPEEIGAMREEFRAFSEAPDDEALKTRLFRRVHDLKGQGGTFDYDLISTIGNDLCRFIERPIGFNERRLSVIGFHIDAMSRVQKEALTGSGNAVGDRMVATLRSMVLKVLDDSP